MSLSGPVSLRSNAAYKISSIIEPKEALISAPIRKPALEAKLQSNQTCPCWHRQYLSTERLIKYDNGTMLMQLKINIASG
jgi:hypothetical protein